eukprot:1000727-Amphidinium_carterae.1
MTKLHRHNPRTVLRRMLARQPSREKVYDQFSMLKDAWAAFQGNRMLNLVSTSSASIGVHSAATRSAARALE